MRRMTWGALALSLLLAAPAAADEAETCAQHAERAPILRDNGRLLEALGLFQSCALERCPRVVREDCRTALADLRDRIPRLAVHVRDDHGVDVTDAQVTVDGQPITTETYAQGVSLDPGTHAVRVVRPPYRASEQPVVIASTDRVRTVDFVLAAPPPTGISLEQTATRNRTASIVVGSVGLGLLGTFGALGTWTLVDYDNLQTACRTGCSASAINEAHTRAYVADAFLGAGVVTLAVASVLWFTAPRRAR